MIGTFIQLAWRNLFRNKRRSFIAGTAIGLGLAALIFTDAMIIGMKENMIQTATNSFLGGGQIHRSGFRQSQSVEATINGLDDIVTALAKESIVKQFTLRAMNLGMISSAANLCAVELVGVQPKTEAAVSQIDDAITEGSFFKDPNDRDIVIGSKLAELLEVGLGDRVVVTVSEAYTGDLVQEMFRVSGIYHFNIREMDSGMAFIHLKKAQFMFGIHEGVHEIAIQFVSSDYSGDESLPFWQKYSQNGNEALGWTKMLPELKAAMSMTDFSTLLIGVILFGVVSLGITNTLFMSLYERMFEFGVLRAVGTRPLGVATLVLCEAGALAVLSIILGNIIGFILTYIVTKVGIDYSGIEFAGVTFRHLIYPVMKVQQFIFYPFWAFILTIIVGIYPALYAAKLTPASAIRKSL
jgi:ABC-type lipoprotein release transport system permease subunit